MSHHYVTSIDGLRVRLPRRCRCGCDVLKIEKAHAPHSVPVTCTRCHKTVGWLSPEQARAIARVIACFGQPTAPVEIRNKWTLIPDETRAASGER
jgi:hypothetical protein